MYRGMDAAVMKVAFYGWNVIQLVEFCLPFIFSRYFQWSQVELRCKCLMLRKYGFSISYIFYAALILCGILASLLMYHLRQAWMNSTLTLILFSLMTGIMHADVYRPAYADLKHILTFINNDLDGSNEWYSIFPLLKTILTSQIVIPEIYDIVKKLQDVMIRWFASETSKSPDFCCVSTSWRFHHLQ